MRPLLLPALALLGLVWFLAYRSGISWHDVRDGFMGRWGQIWRWVVWSPARLLATLVVLALVGWGWSLLGNQARPTSAVAAQDESNLPVGWRQWPVADAAAGPGVPTPSGVPTSSPVPSSPTVESPSSPTVPDPTTSPSTAALPVVAITTATTFLTAWARPTTPQPQWFAAVKPLATPDLAKGLAVTDPRNVPASKVTGKLEVREASPNLTAPTRAVLVATTDGGPIAVTIVVSGKSWLVQSVAPYEQPAED